MKIRAYGRLASYNAGAKLTIPLNNVQSIQIIIDNGDGTVTYKEPTINGNNMEVTAEPGFSVEITALCAASATPTNIITGVGFNDYDVMGDAYFLSAIF